MAKEPGPLRIAVLTLTFFVLALGSQDWLRSINGYRSAVRSLPEPVRWCEQPALWLAICLVALYVAHRVPPRRAFREMGFHSRLGTGLLVGSAATLPMLAYVLLFGSVPSDWSYLQTLFLAGIWPLAEEMLFRGYAFRQLYRRAGWNLWVAAAATGIAFGAVHLLNASVQRMPLTEQTGLIALITVGGVLYAWMFARWNDNLWVPACLHGFMNLWWQFDMAADPLGGWGPNVMRVLTVILAVALTLRYSQTTNGRQKGNANEFLSQAQTLVVDE